MRFYSFTNSYSIGIQAGIQAGHATHEMMWKYQDAKYQGSAKRKVLNDWAENHKTLYVLRAGEHAGLLELYDELKELAAWAELPIIKWHESKGALNGACMAIGLVVPASIYDLPRVRTTIVDSMKEYHDALATPPSIEQQISAIINRYPWAV